VKEIIPIFGSSDGKHLLVAKTLVEFEELLQEFGFMRVHKTASG
jgi:DNA-binding LytR/AlgR family response regulator